MYSMQICQNLSIVQLCSLKYYCKFPFCQFPKQSLNIRDVGAFQVLILCVSHMLIVCVCFCVCVCVCVCLRVNHHDVIELGLKVDRGLPCVRHYIPRSNDKPL